MTEQPVETEQQFLGNETHQHDLQDAIVKSFAGEPLSDHQKQAFDRVMQHHIPNAHRFRPAPSPEAATKPEPVGPTDLHLEAEVHAGHAQRSLENGELDSGIAWLQSALAFAQNARHMRDSAPRVIDLSTDVLATFHRGGEVSHP